MPRSAPYLVSAALVVCLHALAAPPALKVAAFQADATPAPGEPNIWVQPVTSVLDPLFAKGILLDDGQRRFVLVAIDWCGIGGETHLMLRRRIAAAAGTSPDLVALHSVHQHSAPYVDGDAYALLAARHLKALRMSDAYLAHLAANLETAVREAATKLEPFDHIGTALTPVREVASARRILKDGKILVRYSSTAKTPELANEPEGAIDPDLRTITLARGSRPLVRLHYYASHPQTFCCDGRVSADFVGDARERLERESQIPQIYFTACGGDVTVGKYNQGQPAQRTALADRLYAALKAGAANTRLTPVTQLDWRSAELRLPVRTDLPDLSKSAEGQPVYHDAITVAFAKRTRPLPASALTLGDVVILHLPGEPLLEFQRFAQSAAAPRFIAVAGYGDISPGYLCPDIAFQQGGYEPSASNAAPGTEARVKEVILELIRVQPRPSAPNVSPTKDPNHAQ